MATPRMRAEKRVSELLPSATAALRRIMDEGHTVESMAQAVALKTQYQAAMSVIDGCLGMGAAGSGGNTRKAAQILAAVGGDAVTRELQRRYAQKARSSERQRIVEAVPAQSEAQSMQPSAAEADGGDATTRGESASDT
jgi:hypothetical protein